MSLTSNSVENIADEFSIDGCCSSTLAGKEDAVDINMPLIFDVTKLLSMVSSESREYNMRHPHRGKALIINHSSFDKILSLNDRNGTEIDGRNLKKTLENPDFDVRIISNPMHYQIRNIIEELAAEDHTNSDCLIIAVLSHGDDGIVFAKDKSYSLDELWAPFTPDQCRSLADKPKIFLIQACQGTRVDSGTALYPPIKIDARSVYKVPSHPDLLIVFSTAPGFLSFRRPSDGSWFVLCLCEILREQGRDDDFLSLLTLVSRCVATRFESNVPVNPREHRKKQIPCISSTLTRKLYFR